MGILSVFTDSREPSWAQALTFGGVSVSVELIECADLVVGCEDGACLAIERKTANDLLGSLRDERLFPQIARLRELSQWAYLVITGTLSPGAGGKCWADGRETGWSFWSVEAALLTIAESGVYIVRIPSDTDYEQTIIRLASRDHRALTIRPARDMTIASEGETILAGLPGIGSEKAHSLLEYCGSPAWALTFLTSEKSQNDGVPGIGEGIKRRVRRSLGLEDWAELSVVDRNGIPVEKEKTA